MLAASAPGVRAARGSALGARPRGGAARCALRLLVLLALAGLASGGIHKVHRGKHKAASRRDRREAANDNLAQASGGMCHYMEDQPFVEYFECVPCALRAARSRPPACAYACATHFARSTELNVSRWDGRSMDGLFHCNRGTDEYCTMVRVVHAARRVRADG